MNSYNKISIYAEDAEVTNQEIIGSTGYVYDDTTWRGTVNRFEPRINGAYQGIAKSIDYNTALRQATLMSAVFADVLAIRNSKSSDNGYANMENNGIGTKYTDENSLESHISNLSNIFSKGKFLFDNEVITSKIDDKAITTNKINNNAVTYEQLGSVLGTKTVTTNGITVTLSQTNNKGAISINLTGNSVTNANNINIAESTSKEYLTGVSNISGYNSVKIHQNVYMQSGAIYATMLSASDAVISNTFNARSDRRLKYDIENIDDESIINLVENMNVYMFKYNNNSKQSIGMIAQELEQYNINNKDLTNNYNFVNTDNNYLSIEENKLIYVLWKYVNILNNRINKLINKG